MNFFKPSRRNRRAHSASKFHNFEPLETRTLLAAATVSVIASFPNASETSPTRSGRGEFLFSRLGAVTAPLVVHYSVANTSTATSGADFQALSGVVTIPAGRKSAAVNLFPIDDAIHENPETVVVKVTANSSYNIGTSTATVTIADNDPLVAPVTVGVYATFPNASETSPHGSGRGEFLFSRKTGSVAQPLVLQYYVRGTSTATSGVDFEALSGTVTIPAGKRSAAVNLFPIDDAIVEDPETVIAVVKDSASYTIIHRTATVTIADNDVDNSSDWFGDTRHFRQSISINSGSFARSNQPVDNSINFTDILTNDLSASGSLTDNSIRVVEVSADGQTLIDGNVPFQFDKDSDFNASSKASGDLVILTKGATAANTTRYYQVYFDIDANGGSFSAPSFTSLVTTTDNTTDQGQSAIEIDTQTANYWLQKQNGGFSSIVDKNGNDWLSFDPTSGSHAGGEFRGTPNAVYPGGGFHAGFVTGSTVIIHSGPLKTTIESTVSVDKQIAGSPFTYKMRYEIYPTFVRATVVQADDSYWFLYEGTPGGSVDGNDTVVRSDGTVTGIGTSWDDNDGLGNGTDATASGGEEWAYFRDSAVGKYIYYVHDTPDTIKDSYYLANDNGQMTVFGFGRDNSVSDPNREKLTAINDSFTFGIADGGGTFSDSKTLIDGVYHDVSTTNGAADSI